MFEVKFQVSGGKAAPQPKDSYEEPIHLGWSQSKSFLSSASGPTPMHLLGVAQKLLESSLPVVQTYEQLLALWGRAQGAEAAAIGALIEGFIVEAPIDVVIDLCKLKAVALLKKTQN